MDPHFAIRTEQLTKVYSSGNTEVVAMRDATLSVRPGEVVALLGPSGSGKTTFLSAVGLVNAPTSGRIHIGGRLIVDGPHFLTNLRTFRRRHIGYVFQNSNLIPFLTARENVQIALELNHCWPRDARRRAVELLETLGVADRADQRPSTLSGGQQQRVAIARALANRPSVILADEPTAALDSRRGRQVMNLLAQAAHAHGAGVIVVTHDSRALDLFDTIYHMEDGVLRRAAKPADQDQRPGGTGETG
jgi:putative ABC transport system ATP-binding protein